MRAAAAEVAVESVPDVCLAWGLVRLQQCGRAHDHPARAVAALRHLRVDEGGLQRVRFFRRAKPLEGDDRLALRVGNRGLTRSGRRTVNHDRAGAALAQAAAELRCRQTELTQHIEKWFGGIRRFDGLRTAVDAQCVRSHVTAPFPPAGPTRSFPRYYGRHAWPCLGGEGREGAHKNSQICALAAAGHGCWRGLGVVLVRSWCGSGADSMRNPALPDWRAAPQRKSK